MSTQVIHISDLHIRKKVVETKLIKVANIFDMKYDKHVLLITGDLTQSGSKEEFSHTEVAINKIIKSVNKNIIPIILFVPGNHDVRDFEELPKIDHKSFDLEKENYLQYMDNFYNFANKYDLYKDSQFYDYRIVEDGDFRIKFGLLNSVVKEKNMGSHMIDIDELASSIVAESDFSILSMHHSMEHFYQDTKLQLEAYADEYENIIIYGHEHSARTRKNGVNTIISRAGQFKCNLSFNPDDTYVNEIVIDLSENMLFETAYKWNGKEFSQYIETKNEHIEANNNSNFKTEYLNTYQSDMKYFVFPRITKNSKKGKAKIIKTVEELKAYESNKSIILLEGVPQSGKSSLLRNIQMCTPKDKVAILMSSEFFGKPDFIVQNQMSFDYKSQFYNKLKPENKILLIDDIEKTNFFYKIDNEIDKLTKSFGTIYIACDSIIEVEKILMKRKYEFVALKINPFVGSLRSELIRKAFPNINNEKIEQIEKIMKSESKVLRKTPDEILKYARILSSPGYDESRKDTSYINIFKLSLKEMVNSIQMLPFESISMILENLAFDLHFKVRSTYFTQTEFGKAVAEYTSFNGRECCATTILNELTNIKFFKTANSSYYFCDNNTFSYFVAKSLQRKMASGEIDNSYVDVVINNISFGLNSNIMLFLSYISLDMNILDTIVNKCEQYMSDWSIFDVSITQQVDKVSLLAHDENSIIEMRAKNIESKDLEESMQHEISISYIDNYEYKITPENEIHINLQMAKMYTEIVAKILYNFQFEIAKETADSISKMLVENPYKISFAFLNDAIMTYEQIILEENLGKEEIRELKKFVNFLIDIVTYSVTHHFANLIPDIETFKTIKGRTKNFQIEINDKSTSKVQALGMNTDFINLCMLSATKQDTEFRIALFKFDTKYPNSNIHKIALKVYLVENESLDYRDIQHYNSIYFNEGLDVKVQRKEIGI